MFLYPITKVSGFTECLIKIQHCYLTLIWKEPTSNMSEKIYYVLHANSNFWHDKYGDILGIYDNLDQLRHDAYLLISNVLKDYPLSRISDNKIYADSGLAITGGPINTNPQDNLRFSQITVRISPHVDTINFDIEESSKN